MEATAHPQIKKYTTGNGDQRYLVRYRQASGRQTMKRGFPTVREARDWLDDWRDRARKGATVSVSAGRATVAQMWAAHHARKAARLKPTSISALEGAWDNHVSPRWGDVPVAKVTAADVQAWASDLAKKRSASVTIRCVEVLRGCLDIAVRDGRVYTNTAAGITLPRKPRGGKQGEARRYLSHVEVRRLAEAAGTDRAIIVYVAAYSGLRFGEINGLRVEDYDAGRRRLHVRRSISQQRDGQWVTSTPKTWEQRTVPVPNFLGDLLDDHVKGKAKRRRLFERHSGDTSKPLPYPGTSDRWAEAVWIVKALAIAGIEPLRMHDLRHTAASLAVQAGASVKVVQRMLGHRSAAMTLDVYADLFDDDLDEVADRLGAAHAEATKAHLRAV